MRYLLTEDQARTAEAAAVETGETLAFKTHRYLGEAEVLFLLGGVDPRYKGLGLGVANEYCELNALIDREVKRGYTHFPTGNYPVINLELGQLGFRLMQAYAVLRKIYGALPGR